MECKLKPQADLALIATRCTKNSNSTASTARQNNLVSAPSVGTRSIMLSGISIICFAACYAMAFVLEILGLKRRFAWHRALLVVITLAGLAAHSLYLLRDMTATRNLPLSTADWLLWAAWL